MGKDKQQIMKEMPEPTPLEKAAEDYLDMKDDFISAKEDMENCAGVLSGLMREAKTYKITVRGKRIELKHVDKYEVKVNKPKAV